MPIIKTFHVAATPAESSKEAIDALVNTLKLHMHAHHHSTVSTFILQVIRQLPELHSLGLTKQKLISFTTIPTPQTLLNEWVRLNKKLKDFGFTPKEVNDMLNKEEHDFINIRLLVERFNDFRFFGFTQIQLYSMFMKNPGKLPMMAGNYFCLMHALNNTITPDIIYTIAMRVVEDERHFNETNNRVLDCKFLLNSPINNNVAFTSPQIKKLRSNLMRLYMRCRAVDPETLAQILYIPTITLLNLKCLYAGNGFEPLLVKYKADQELFRDINFSLFKRPTPQTPTPEQSPKRLKEN